MSDPKTAPPPSDSAVIAELQERVEFDQGVIQILSKALGGAIFLTLIFLFLNFGLTPAEDRWLLPKRPEGGDRCLWYHHNVCATWNIYAPDGGTHVKDTQGFAEACKEDQGRVVYRGISEGPGRLRVTTWSCEI